MGEAKRRGTFEQRQAEGMVKRAEAEERRKQVQAERVLHRKEKRLKSSLIMASLEAIIGESQSTPWDSISTAASPSIRRPT